MLALKAESLILLAKKSKYNFANKILKKQIKNGNEKSKRKRNLKFRKPKIHF